MDKNDILKELNYIVDNKILRPTDFWLSNRSALVIYGIKESVDYLIINCRQNIFNNLIKRNNYIYRIERKKKITDLKPNVLLYEDNRPCKFTIIHGFKVETIYSIMAKKLFYASDKDLEQVDEIQQFLKKHSLP
ncbi:hypothetical protein H2684_10180 [Clostridium sp. cel8]|jgi:hypothetical protein|uniref:hypothetical protein n=1 Tax=unclassified Clostridium TaxID=2614128 RepID=UPI0015F5F985|nr:hypothetical protein [Clostridium sp. cel8]MBA5851668.1 hypothetical protein [Clostridium sp. cel8]